MSLGALFEGLQSGIATRDKMDMNRQYKRLLEQRAHLGEMDIAGINEVLGSQGMETMDFMPQPDPAGMRLFGWLKNKIGFGGGEGQASNEGIQEEPQRERSAPDLGGAIGFQDGGRVRPRGRGYSDRRNRDPITWDRGVPSRDVPTSGGGVGEFMRDFGRSAADYFDDTRRSALAGDEDVYEEFDQLRNSETAAQAGGNFRDWAIDSARAGGATAVGVAKDAFVDNPLIGGPVRFVGGMLGIGDDEDIAERQAIDAPADAPAGADAATQATAPAPETSDEQVAQRAIAEGEETAAENFDYRMLPEGTRPEDLPSMTTEDWIVNRRQMMRGLLLRGMNPSEALQQVDDVTVNAQMRGMERELLKAMNYLEMNDLRAAGFAIRQGFQYFPNGVDVRLAIQEGNNGQRALVAFGVSEETGEPTGQPMIITTESLGRMRENFSNPATFRQWTKDGQDLQLKIAQLEDLSQFRQDSIATGRANAITSRINALGGGEGGGMRPSDFDRRSGDIVEALQMQEFGERLPEGAVMELASVGELVMQLKPNWGAQQIAKSLRDAWTGEPGGEAGIIEFLESLRGE